jgi:hypothetical protein
MFPIIFSSASFYGNKAKDKRKNLFSIALPPMDDKSVSFIMK